MSLAVIVIVIITPESTLAFQIPLAPLHVVTAFHALMYLLPPNIFILQYASLVLLKLIVIIYKYNNYNI